MDIELPSAGGYGRFLELALAKDVRRLLYPQAEPAAIRAVDSHYE
jgi:hypothetical protein